MRCWASSFYILLPFSILKSPPYLPPSLSPSVSFSPHLPSPPPLLASVLPPPSFPGPLPRRRASPAPKARPECPRRPRAGREALRTASRKRRAGAAARLAQGRWRRNLRQVTSASATASHVSETKSRSWAPKIRSPLGVIVPPLALGPCRSPSSPSLPSYLACLSFFLSSLLHGLLDFPLCSCSLHILPVCLINAAGRFLFFISS